jgi:hypothetical protein
VAGGGTEGRRDENDDGKGFIGADDERGRASSFLHSHIEAGDGVGRAWKRFEDHRRRREVAPGGWRQFWKKFTKLPLTPFCKLLSNFL